LNKTISIIRRERKDIADIFKNGVETDLLFRELQKDTVGRSGANPTWGYVYTNVNKNLKYNGIALYKEFDYDFPFAAYAEKAWSIFGKELLDDTVRVANIDIVERKPNYPEMISYRLMDNDGEDMIHIKDILFNKFERGDIRSKKDILTIDELLECIKLQIPNEENYKVVEKDVIQVLLLDAITNNGDRHACNWALVRNEVTDEYCLGVFDHATTFIDMFENRAYLLGNGWCATYITVGSDMGRNDIGSSAEKLVDYISKKYPKYFEDFCEKFFSRLPDILEKIKQEKMSIDFNRLVNKMGDKKYYFKKLRSRGEIGDE